MDVHFPNIIFFSVEKTAWTTDEKFAMKKKDQLFFLQRKILA